MMVKVIEDRVEIESLYQLFERRIREFFTEIVHCRVGYPGGSVMTDVNYSPTLNLWVAEQRHPTRFWNGFGIGRPIYTNSNSLVGEINFPYADIKRGIAGAFAKENGGTLVLHRGTIGGGKRGIGKTLFLKNFRGDFVTALDGNRETEFCLIGEINSPHFPDQVAAFISEIRRIKNLDLSILEHFEYLNNFEFTDEHSGITALEGSRNTLINRTHGIIVNRLASELERGGLSVANDRNRDLFIYNGNNITTLFEIKTTSSTQAIYAAVGQLLIYSIPIIGRVTLVVVLPKQLDERVEQRLSELGIQILYYIYENGQPSFINLNRFV